MNTTSKHVMLEATGLEPGARMRIRCPACQGGSKRAKTLSIMRHEDGSTYWSCWRNSCSEWGRDGVATNLVRNRIAPPRPKPYRKSLVKLTEDQRKELGGTIGWDEDHCTAARVRWAEDDNRFAFPIFSPLGAIRGYVLRSYDPSAFPKALTYMDTPEPHLSWYRGPTETLVVVEDIPSAVRASRYASAVALCGTSISKADILELARNVDNVVWALDADALGTSIKHNRNTNLIFDTTLTLPLESDLKDMAEPALRTLLHENVND